MDNIRENGIGPILGVNRNQPMSEEEAFYRKSLENRAKSRKGIGVSTLSTEGTTTPALYEQGTAGYEFGKSKYDTWTGMPVGTMENLQQERYENQSSWDVLGNGLVKMLGTAGSTIASTLVGLPVGLGYAIGEGRWSGIWDNPVMEGLAKFDEYMKDNFKNYQSLEQQQNTENGQWWRNMDSMNWWADDVITNIGFTLGAMAAGATVGAGLGMASRLITGTARAATAASSIAPNIATGITSLVSASGEAAIEANNNTREWKNLEYQRLDDDLDKLYANDTRVSEIQEKYQQRAEALKEAMQNDPNIGKFTQQGENGKMVDPVMKQYLQQFEQLESQMKQEMQAIDAEKEERRAAGRAQIDEDARRAGNRIMAGNQVFLTLSNLVTMGKVFDKSFKNASKYQNLMNSKEAGKMVGNRASGLTTAERAAAAKEGELYTARSAKNQLARDWLAPIVTEGQEEMNQKWISSSSTAYYEHKDANDYWRARLDPKAIENTIDGSHDFGSALSKGFADSWANPAAWEEFVVGSLTGLGSGMIQNKFGTDVMNQVREAQQSAKALNDLIGSDGYFNKLAQLAVTASYYEGLKEEAAKNGDIKSWKDADDKEMASIIEAYYRAGKLNDLKEDIQDAGGELTDEQIQELIKNTSLTPEQTKDRMVKPMRDEVARLGDEVTELEKMLAELTGQSASEPEQQPQAPPSVQQPEAPAEPQAPQQPTHVSDPGLEEAARGGFGNIDPNKQADGSSDLFSTAENAEAERQDNIERLREEIQKKRAKIAELNAKIDATQGVVSGPFIDDESGNPITVEEARETIKHNKDAILTKIDDYVDSMNSVRAASKGNLDNQTENELAFLHHIRKASRRRLKNMATVWQESRTPDRMDLVWDKEENGSVDQLREKLRKQYGDDINVFEDEETPDGFVTLDLSKLKAKKDDLTWLAAVTDLFINGAHLHKGKDASEDTLSTMMQRKYAIDQLRYHASVTDQDEGDLVRSVFEELPDINGLFKDMWAYRDAFNKAMEDPSKLRKKAKKLKDKVKKKFKDKSEAAAWDNASFEDFQAGKLNGIEPKTEAQKRKKRGFERRAGIKRDMADIVGGTRFSDQEKKGLNAVLDGVLDGAVDEDGNIDMSQVERFMQDPEAVIRELFERNGEVLSKIIDEQNLENDEYIEAAIQRLSNHATSISNDVFDRLKELEKAEGNIEIDDEVLKGAEEREQPEVPDRALERQPSDVSPVGERAVDAEEARRRAEPEQPAMPVDEQRENAEEAEKNPYGEVPEEDRSGLWGTETTEFGYGNAHRPWYQEAQRKLSEKKKEPGYNPNVPFALFENPNNPRIKPAAKTEKQWLNLIKRSEAIYKYLKDTAHTYDYLNEGNVKGGDEVFFATSRSLNGQTPGGFVILLVDSSGMVIGNLQDKATRKDLAPLQDALFDEYRNAEEEEGKDLVIFDKSKYKSKVARRYIGGAQYGYTTTVTDEGIEVDGERIESTLNELANKEGKPLIIGISTNNGGVVTNNEDVNNGRTKVTNSTVPGQPVLLIETRGAIHDDVKYTTAPIASDRINESMTPIIGLLNAVIRREAAESGKAGHVKTEAYNIIKQILNADHVEIHKSDKGNIVVKIGITQRVGGKVVTDTDGRPVNDYYSSTIRVDETLFEEDFKAFINTLQTSKIGINISADWLNPKSIEDNKSAFKMAYDVLSGYWNADFYGEMPTDYVTMLGDIISTNVQSLYTHRESFAISPVTVKNGKVKKTAASADEQDWKASPRPPRRTAAQLRQAQSDKEIALRDALLNIRNNTLGIDKQGRRRQYWDALVDMFGVTFMRSGLGTFLSQQLRDADTADKFSLDNATWNELLRARQVHVQRMQDRQFAQSKVGELADSGVDFNEEKHEYTLRSLGKKLKGITSTLLNKIYEKLYGSVDSQVMKTAADRGHKIHKWIENLDNNRDFVLPETESWDNVTTIYDAYRKALADEGLYVAANEYTVTDGTAFASNIDLVLTDKDGNIVLGDIKTTAPPRDAETAQNQRDYVTSQLSIYRNMYKRQNQGKQVLSRGVVVHINKQGIKLEWVNLYDEQKVEDSMRKYRDDNGMEQQKPVEQMSIEEARKQDVNDWIRKQNVKDYIMQYCVGAKSAEEVVQRIKDTQELSDATLRTLNDVLKFDESKQVLEGYVREANADDFATQEGRLQALEKMSAAEVRDYFTTMLDEGNPDLALLSAFVDKVVETNNYDAAVGLEDALISVIMDGEHKGIDYKDLRDTFAEYRRKYFPVLRKETPQRPATSEPQPGTTSLYDQYVAIAGADAEDKDVFDEYFANGYYVDSEGRKQTGLAAIQAFHRDVQNDELPDIPDDKDSNPLYREELDNKQLPKKMDLNRELSWLEKALPQFSKEARLKLLNTLIAAGDKRAYGKFSKGIIYIYKYGAQGTVYHEAFHAVTQGLLTDKELLQLYNAAREKYGNLSIVELEEKLAEGFQQYMIEEQYYNGKEKSIFRKLLDRIKALFEKKDAVDELYRRIHRGDFGNRAVHSSSNVFSTIRDQEIAENRYKLSNTIDDTTSRILKEEGISKSEFNDMTSVQKYILKHCLA